MKILSINLSFFVLTSAIMFVSCNSNKGDKQVNDIKFDTISQVKVYHLNNDPVNPSCTLNLKYIVPNVYSDSGILTKIQQELNIAMFEDERYGSFLPKDAVSQYLLDYVENYKEQASAKAAGDEGEVSEDQLYFNKTLENTVLFNKANLISYQISAIDKRGNGEVYTNYQNIVFDLNTGDIISEDDLFVPQYSKELNSILTNKIFAQKGLKKPEEMIELGYWGIEDVASNNNFLIDEKGLTYIFNEGEFAARTIKEIKIFVSYTEIEDILKENSPISIFTGI